ncbi:nucleotidyltransferase domain-containing protein [Bacterioplanoides sp. SCSIO 12839]|uniref:type VII toxin-antitoxin system MntA family adenylyltransferase antitoxin n=1 Tax=Bacterioplanoides sp. SCSIO 12839 TaxID=2829569 RepID=UPI002104C8BD|nr:nucleotidyltransferase domain-containing protein [Bacterioplanoides sp. SCSIO 12839]UTW49946.1 nucleotidyltransferase domain-containing protein [Bacterioplanoides sp. SCSIO 12839]
MQLPEPLLQQVSTYLQQQGVLAAWLYGSFAQGTANQQSDIVLALLLPESSNSWQQLPEFDSALSDLNQRTVNSISIIEAPTPLAYEAIEGKRLFGEGQAMLIEQRVWSKWEDFKYWSQQE